MLKSVLRSFSSRVQVAQRASHYIHLPVTMISIQLSSRVMECRLDDQIASLTAIVLPAERECQAEFSVPRFCTEYQINERQVQI